jgi:hypothetical protein
MNRDVLLLFRASLGIQLQVVFLLDCLLTLRPFCLGNSLEPVPGCFVISVFYSFILVVHSSPLSLLICFLLAGLHGSEIVWSGNTEINEHDNTLFL